MILSGELKQILCNLLITDEELDELMSDTFTTYTDKDRKHIKANLSKLNKEYIIGLIGSIGLTDWKYEAIDTLLDIKPGRTPRY